MLAAFMDSLPTALKARDTAALVLRMYRYHRKLTPTFSGEWQVSYRESGPFVRV